MKGFLLLAVTITMAHALTNSPYSNYNQGQYGYSPRLGIAGRRDVTESYQQETGNLYAGDRDGRYITRDGADNYRGVQYSVRQGRGDQGFRRYQDNAAYGYRNPQISFTGPLANTRSYNPRFDAGQQNEYRYY